LITTRYSPSHQFISPSEVVLLIVSAMAVATRMSLASVDPLVVWLEVLVFVLLVRESTLNGPSYGGVRPTFILSTRTYTYRNHIVTN
jgi:hypothetical protein